MVILLLALLVLGPDKLPEYAARRGGHQRVPPHDLGVPGGVPLRHRPRRHVEPPPEKPAEPPAATIPDDALDRTTEGPRLQPQAPSFGRPVTRARRGVGSRRATPARADGPAVPEPAPQEAFAADVTPASGPGPELITPSRPPVDHHGDPQLQCRLSPRTADERRHRRRAHLGRPHDHLGAPLRAALPHLQGRHRRRHRHRPRLVPLPVPPRLPARPVQGRRGRRRRVIATEPLQAFTLRLQMSALHRHRRRHAGDPVAALAVHHPGLYPHEKKYAIPFIGSALVLFVLGASLAYEILVPTLEFLVNIGGPDIAPLYTPRATSPSSSG